MNWDEIETFNKVSKRTWLPTRFFSLLNFFSFHCLIAISFLLEIDFIEKVFFISQNFCVRCALWHVQWKNNIYFSFDIYCGNISNIAQFILFWINCAPALVHTNDFIKNVKYTIHRVHRALQLKMLLNSFALVDMHEYLCIESR